MKEFDSMVSGVWRALLGIGFALTIVTSAVGQTTTESDPDNADEWRFKLAPLYIWFAGIEGDASIGPVTAPVDVSFGDVLDNLTGIFAFHFEAGKRKWNIFADYMYLELKPGATASLSSLLPATNTISYTQPSLGKLNIQSVALVWTNDLVRESGR